MKRLKPKPRPEVSPPSVERAEASSGPTAPLDVALVHGVTEDGGLRIIRRRGDVIEAGALHPIRQGAPIHGEVLALKPRADFPMLCDVEVQYAPPRVAAAGPPPREPPPRRKGPAQVATDTYRDNWDSIWSAPKKRSEALN